MQCPKCKLEMRLLRRLDKDGKTVSIYVCRDKRCDGSKTQIVKETTHDK